MNWTFEAEIWDEPDGTFGYYAAQSQEDEEEPTILVHGVANNASDAANEINSAIKGVL